MKQRLKEIILLKKRFFILPSELFANVVKRARDDENLNETLEKIFNNIENSAKGAESEDDFSGLFDDIDVMLRRGEPIDKILDYTDQKFSLKSVVIQ